ncbi:hypothetical protein EW026_g4553 [Hermanssonia centrifuga]|uniref:Ubiquitin-like domain-containing protein n=1 Tax=Hermanssonia centrifuga TaxID=98765 RepID=A0A4S4KHJ3_9APHY|nr:hypothetical protein EW026_g4553 [Hermanssonia centrifuga]
MATNSAQAVRHAKPPPTGPTPPAPATTPPVPPNNTNAHAHPPPANRQPNGTVNGTHAQHQKGKKKTTDPPPVDPSQMYETLKNKIAALEEEEVHEEEEERRFAEEAQDTVQGLEENAIHAKYIELFAELKRLERDHAKEKQKLVKDKDAAKNQLTKANQTKTKMENLARELQKDNKRLREDSKRLAQCVEEAQEEIIQMKNDMAKRAERAKVQDVKYRDMPDIVVKVICKYRAELFFKISRKTKLSKLFSAWTDRMEGRKDDSKLSQGGSLSTGTPVNGAARVDGPSVPSTSTMQFIFSYGGRTLEADQTPEEAGMEDGDEILAVEMMDLTEGPGIDDLEEVSKPHLQKFKKHFPDNPRVARRAMEEIFDGVVRERLKEVLRQYELRERHFECVIRSKELEVLLSRARAAEQKQLADGEKARAEKAEDEAQHLRQDLETVQNGQTALIDKLIACCKEPNAERTQRLFASLREELERRGTKLADGPVGG